MEKYCFVLDEETGLVQLGAGCSDEYYIERGMVLRDVEQSEKDMQWYLTEKCPHYTPEEIEEMERQRILSLHLTRGDVFRGLLMARQITRAQVRAIIEAMPDETPEQQIAKEYALIDFDESLDFFRGVGLIDTLGQQLGISSEAMTQFFETNDWHYLVPDTREG